MSFGLAMTLRVGEYAIELAPLSKEIMGEFVGGISQPIVRMYMPGYAAHTLEDELTFYDETRLDKTKLVWGIFVKTEKGKILIGVESMFDITLADTRIYHATTGSMIFRQEYWGKGIVTAVHKARTWYAFQHMGISRLLSSVSHGNVGSLKALQHSGYNIVYVERNTKFINGTLHHQDNLECLNPLEPFWSEWWHGETPTKAALKALQATKDAMEWAQENVTLL
jgi:RimJ/RimL family protein N-acetyltransferase